MSKLLPEEQATKDSYDKAAKAWISKHNTPNWWGAEMKKFHELLKNGSVLEIGAGGARDAKELLALGYTYVGTDVSPGLVEEARKELPSQEFYEQSVYDLSFPDREKFDGFWASAVLLHIPKSRIDEALARIKTVVKPGGIGFVSIKGGEGESFRVKEFAGEEMKQFFAYWQKEAFAAVLEKNGYQVVDYIFHPDERGNKWLCFFVKIND